MPPPPKRLASVKPGRSFPAAAASGGKVYVFGGFDPQGGKPLDLRVFEPKAERWSAAQPFGWAFSHGIAAAYGGKVYVAGGCADSDCRVGVTRDLRIYDPMAATVVPGPAMPTRRIWAASAFDEKRWYFAGGSGPCPPCEMKDRLEAYDFADARWVLLAPMPRPRWKASAAIVGRTMIVMGGELSPGRFTDMVDAYDIDSDRWSPRKPMPAPRCFTAVAAIGTRIYVAGGAGLDATDNAKSVPTLEAYDPEADRWERKRDMPAATSAIQGVAMDGRLEVVGEVLFLYDPGSDRWTSLPGVPND